MLIFLFCLYIALSATGLLFIKQGTSGTAFSATGGLLRIDISLRLLLGILLYVISFVLSMVIMSQMNLSLMYPLGAGLINLIVCFFSIFVLKESLSVLQWAGVMLIALGVVLMNIKSQS